MSILNNAISYSLSDYSDALGFVVWHSIADIRVSEAEISRLAGIYGIQDPPKLGHPADAFRRATSASQVRDESGTVRYLMRPVADNAESVIREIVVERVDKQGKKLSHFGAFRLTYDKATNYIDVEDICGMKAFVAERDDCRKLADEAVARYSEFANSLTGKELTRFAQKQLERMSYIMLRPNGGCYFVLASNRAKIEALMGFFAHLAQYKVTNDPIIFSAAPVPNDPLQKAQIATGLEITVGSEVDQMIAKLADLRDNIDSVRESTLASKAAEIAELRAKVSNYSAMIETESGILTARLEILDQTIDALFDRFADANTAKIKAERKPIRKAKKTA